MNRESFAYLLAIIVIGVLTATAAGAWLTTLSDGGASPPEERPVKVFTVVAYHWGFVVYDSQGAEVDAVRVNQGDLVVLNVVGGADLGEAIHHELEERIIEAGIGDYAPGDEEIHEVLEEAQSQGLLAHGLLIDGYGITVPAVGGSGEPGEIVQTVTFVADRTGSFNFVCTVFCGYGHAYMRLPGGLVVSP